MQATIIEFTFVNWGALLFCDSLTWFNWFLLALPFVLNPTFLHLDFLTHLFESWLANFLRNVFAPRLLELELIEATYSWVPNKRLGWNQGE